MFDIKREFLDGIRIQAADVTIDSRMGRTRGSLGIGGNYNRADRYAASGEVTADSDFSGRYVISAMARLCRAGRCAAPAGRRVARRPGSPTIAFEPRACQPARGAMFTMCTRGAEPNNPFAMFGFRLT
ncbi:hypothetical protein L514_0670 [Bordetella bronchiseptica MBORD635]|uniref:hypothetical protein n=1 Tax=Bordetella bronchiseptica TaxID=518 RepID=UPI000461A83D|nr:hypothetical protein [Bordetella bronchiseptica]KDC79607.1 hypothetical protein L514_0670 [Bordetella bronchiseptica MBORD635]